MILDLDQRTFREMKPTEQRKLLEEMVLDNDPFWASGEASITYEEELLSKFFPRKRSRKPKNGAYVTCAWLASKTGYSANTIRVRALKEKSGIDKRTFSGRNRKVYTVLRVSKVAAKRMFPDLDI
jgi:hypothetical protein